MRIGVFIEPVFNQKAGIHQFTKQLIEAIGEFGTRDYVQLGTRSYHPEIPSLTLPHAATGTGHPARWFNTNAHFLDQHNIDLFIDPSHFGSIGLLPSSKRIVIVHDITPLILPQFHRFKTVIGHRLLMKSWLQRSKAVITVSDQTKNDMLHRFDRLPHIERIYPGAPNMSPSTPHKIPYERYILCPGTIEPRKNIQRSIEAFSQIKDESLHLIFTGIDGWGPNFDALLSKSTCSHRIHHLGYVDRESLMWLYNNAVATLYPSLYEGFGLPVLEAMVAGCPVITSNRGATKEIAQNATLLVDPMQTQSIREAIQSLIQDDRLCRQLIEKGHKRSKDFIWKQYVETLEEVIRRML